MKVIVTDEPPFAEPVGSIDLRDYFAAHALAGILACEVEFTDVEGPEDRVKIAYEHADAMLAARK